MQKVLTKYKSSIKLYLSLHSYGELVLYPWGYDEILIQNWEHQEQVAKVFADAIHKATGTNYTVGNTAKVLHPTSGSSADYAASLGIPVALNVELRGGGNWGYDMPPHLLKKAVEETWIGFRMLIEFISKNK